MPTPSTLVELLNESSSNYRDPLTRLAWDSLDSEGWWLPPQALSLAGVPRFESLPITRRRRLSRYEFVWLLEAGLWLEALFAGRLGGTLDTISDLALRSRHLHEIREEAGHSLMFIELMQRSGVRIPNAARYRPALGRWLTRRLKPCSALFWALVAIGEDLPDKLNRKVRCSVEEATVSPLIYQMATLLIIDEARHIAHARAMCTEASAKLPAWWRRLLSPLLQRAMRGYTHFVFYPPAAVYELAGLPDGRSWRCLARGNAVRAQLVAHAVAPTCEFLRGQGWHVRVQGV